MTPKQFGNKEEHWREWCEEVRDYLDVVKPGMKDLLIAAEKETELVVDVAWAKSKNDELGNEGVQLWRALKKLTEDYSEARQVVTSVPDEDGYAAWAKLHKRYGMALAMKQGTMLANFSSLGTNKCKSPSETRSRVIEIDRMAQMTHEITGHPVGDGHWKSVLVGMLDPVTRQHTANLMGSKHTANDLKNAILEFTSNVVLDDNAMNIGHIGERKTQDKQEDQGGGEGDAWGDWSGTSGWDPGDGANALGKGGPKGGCWHCGGPHYSNQCPKGKGKGAGGKGKGGGKADGKGSKGGKGGKAGGKGS